MGRLFNVSVRIVMDPRNTNIRDPAIRKLRKLSLVGKPVKVIDMVVSSRKELYSHMKSGSRRS